MSIEKNASTPSVDAKNATIVIDGEEFKAIERDFIDSFVIESVADKTSASFQRSNKNDNELYMFGFFQISPERSPSELARLCKAAGEYILSGNKSYEKVLSYDADLHTLQAFQAAFGEASVEVVMEDKTSYGEGADRPLTELVAQLSENGNSPNQIWELRASLDSLKS